MTTSGTTSIKLETDKSMARSKKILFELVALLNSLKSLMDIGNINYDGIGKAKLNELILTLHLISKTRTVSRSLLEHAIDDAFMVITGIIQNIGSEINKNGG